MIQTTHFNSFYFNIMLLHNLPFLLTIIFEEYHTQFIILTGDSILTYDPTILFHVHPDKSNNQVLVNSLYNNEFSAQLQQNDCYQFIKQNIIFDKKLSNNHPVTKQILGGVSKPDILQNIKTFNQKHFNTTTMCYVIYPLEIFNNFELKYTKIIITKEMAQNKDAIQKVIQQHQRIENENNAS